MRKQEAEKGESMWIDLLTKLCVLALLRGVTGQPQPVQYKEGKGGEEE